MDNLDYLQVVLSFGTLGFIGVLAYLSARATEKLKDDPSHKRSSLCRTHPEWAKTRRAS